MRSYGNLNYMCYFVHESSSYILGTYAQTPCTRICTVEIASPSLHAIHEDVAKRNKTIRNSFFQLIGPIKG